MGFAWNRLLDCLDYAARYITLKMGRTIVISVFVMLFILLLRRVIDGKKGKKTSGSRLYCRVYLWTLLIPIPFMGTLKLSAQYFRWRNPIYIFLYENIMGNPLWSRLYFAGMAVVGIWLLVRKIRLCRDIRRLPSVDPPALHIPEESVGRAEIRRNPSTVPPFSMGIFKPVIVLPERMLEQFDDREIQEILQHEYNHIRRGHLVIYFIMDCFRIIWFINPLVHFCIRWIKEDLELLCDHDTIRFGTLSSEDYGMLLIRSLNYMGCEKGRLKGIGETPALAAECSFQVMKKRIRLIADYRECTKRHKGVIRAAMVGILLGLFILIRILSYPSYTPYGDYSMYSQDGKETVFMNNPEFDHAVLMSEDGIVVQNDKVKQLLSKTDKKYGKDDFFWIYYGGYMKLPGIGGGGDIVEYQPYGTDEAVVRISCGKKEKLDVLMDWIFKYM